MIFTIKCNGNAFYYRHPMKMGFAIEMHRPMIFYHKNALEMIFYNKNVMGMILSIKMHWK